MSKLHAQPQRKRIGWVGGEIAAVVGRNVVSRSTLGPAVWNLRMLAIMSTETSPSNLFGDTQPADLGTEIRRTAEQAARQGRLAQERSNAAVAAQQSAESARIKGVRQKRVLGALLGVFLLLSALNLAGFGVHAAPQQEAWTEESLDRYLREELQFEAEEIESFAREQGRLPYSLEEAGSRQTRDLFYETFGEDGYQITITDSGKSLTYDSSMDPVRVFGERIDD